jgi:hypothetical protein
MCSLSIGADANIGTGKSTRRGLIKQKKAVRECLDVCPVDVIRRFFNRSWRFMDAYRRGLTGKAAEWAVCKQRSHRRVGQQAMASIEAVLNTN